MNTKSLSFTLVWTAFGLVVLTAIWLAYIGIQISSAGHRFTSQALKATDFDQYRKALRLEQLPAPKSVAFNSEKAARDASVAQIFEWIAEFENGRASDRLKKLKPLLSGVVFGGLAERIGMRAGDEV
ncbi:MAG: hypothetical protein ACKOCR_06985, partial [Burkholderiaceae bacterium]